MKITKIEKKKRLYLVEINQTDKLYVTEDTIVRFMLSKDQTISPQELEKIKDFAQFSYGKDLALYHLSFKQRTEKEVRDYLLEHDIDPKTCSKVISSLKEDKWLDDAKYTQNLLDQNLSTGDKGAYLLKQKLHQKGIKQDLYEAIIDQADFYPLCQKIAQKLLRKYQNKLPNRALKDKIIQTLCNKGFSFQEGKMAFDSLVLEEEEDVQNQLLDKEFEKQHRKLSRKYDGYDLRQRLTQALLRKGYDYDAIKKAVDNNL